MGEGVMKGVTSRQASAVQQKRSMCKVAVNCWQDPCCLLVVEQVSNEALYDEGGLVLHVCVLLHPSCATLQTAAMCASQINHPAHQLLCSMQPESLSNLT